MKLTKKENRVSADNSTDFPRLVAFFGPDGAGKSTQAGLLSRLFESKGLKVKRAWIRSTHTFAYLLWRLFYRLKLCEDRSGMTTRISSGFAVSYLNESSYGAVSPITMSPPILRGSFSRFLWSIVELIGIVPVVLLQVYLPLFLGFTVVAERYVVDSVASIAYFLGDDQFDRTWQARLLLSLVPRGTLFVFIDAHYSTIVSRRQELAGPEDYTNFHRRMFKRLAKRLGAVHLDASANSIDELQSEILANIRERFGVTVYAV